MMEAMMLLCRWRVDGTAVSSIHSDGSLYSAVDVTDAFQVFTLLSILEFRLYKFDLKESPWGFVPYVFTPKPYTDKAGVKAAYSRLQNTKVLFAYI